MTNYLIAQAINIALLVALGFVLIARTRAEFHRRIRALEGGAAVSDGREQRKVELRAQIEILQQELNELDRPQHPVTSALLPSDRPRA